ncbi:protein FAF-like, chloroplastic [Cucurbita maxima]|uniref:Protein FAF-like, chloroplastic n=1 Tax=Cucurbita maxima TaxID=3661 RepID=A0A6J1K356_CUCMA|nr:protein FAF-like, chloroplastic [Cucurbita maxima]
MADSVPFMNSFNHYKSFQKQGILTILPSHNTQLPINPPPSLRRTLSADMSSTKWITRHGSPAISKTASFQALSAAHSSSFEQRVGFSCSVPQDHKNNVESRKQEDLDSWRSILFQNSVSDAPKSPALPYVHPLDKKSTNSLGENSLLICTESLGSESGSDGFSSYPSSEAGDFDGEIMKTEYPFQWKPVKFGRKKTPPRSFPPMISSLTSSDGGSVSIQSRRENGRLILDACSVPSQKNFLAERRDGRLILSFVTTPANLNVQEEEDEFEELIAGDFEEVKESEDEENDLVAEELEIPMEKTPILSSSVMNFHRLAMMMKKTNGLINRNPAWPKEKDAPLSQSLPTRSPSLAAASLNPYEYYWQSKPTGKSAGIKNPIGRQQNQLIDNETANENQQIKVVRGNRGECLVPLSNCCKVPRRSLVLLREHCCIATT